MFVVRKSGESQGRAPLMLRYFSFRVEEHTYELRQRHQRNQKIRLNINFARMRLPVHWRYNAYLCCDLPWALEVIVNILYVLGSFFYTCTFNTSTIISQPVYFATNLHKLISLWVVGSFHVKAGEFLQKIFLKKSRDH